MEKTMFKFLGGLVDSNEKVIKRLQPIVDQINSLEPEFGRTSNEQLGARTDDFKARMKDGDSPDELLPEAFAAVREAARRTIGQRHFDAQLMGGVVLHQGKIAEMKTGEGKTLVATLPLYLNALMGEGCHLVTVNDYLARRDPYWMGPIYHLLGMKVGSIYPQQNPDEHSPSRLYDPAYDSGKESDPWRHFRPVSRREAYEADITYGTSSEFGFDYLRDNMVMEQSRYVQRSQYFAIVDEVDNLLIDEARTPLIISAPDVEATQKYQVFVGLVQRLEREKDYEVKEKERSIELTDSGYAKVEGLLNRQGLLTGSLYDVDNVDLMRHLMNALTAKESYRRDREYVVKDGQIIIVDEFTGRLMVGRRYSEGLHQAIEAKERVKVQQESRTYATITIQNYFRMYQKLAGMTGTAATEAEEFYKIYKLEVVSIPTHKPMIREDLSDQIYKSEEGKYRAVVREVKRLHQQGSPVLLGTVSIKNSEYLGDLMKKQGIPYKVLNAKYHEKEAGIIARAGEPGAVTVATNMAGRGVDIVLGGSPDGQSEKEWQEKYDKVLELGGLHIIGTERHEARRIDNQLRGRAGRQGDPGRSRFYVSLGDDIMRRFGGDRIKGLMEWAGMGEDTPIENALITKAITDVQKRVEGYHFDMRKHLVEYDDVINKHREVIYAERRKILEGIDLKENILSMVKDELRAIVTAYIADEHGINWDMNGLVMAVSAVYPPSSSLSADAFSQLSPRQIEAKIIEYAENLYEEREQEVGTDNTRVIERLVMLRTIDTLWVDHLTVMENMRQAIGLQAIGQRDPLIVYKREGHRLFQNLMANIQHDLVRTIYRVSVKRESPQPEASPMAKVASGHVGGSGKQKVGVGGKKIGRNEPCPCGSGKKYKHCCGK